MIFSVLGFGLFPLTFQDRHNTSCEYGHDIGSGPASTATWNMSYYELDRLPRGTRRAVTPRGLGLVSSCRHHWCLHPHPRQ
ncbi:hypothetical protein C8J57DRAFT_524235 [Mycena rebaudengoi]|nr:hypothetical protein C8J57DRAFT_229718 [Mycena rebaudengoi]KAJ7258929.1 hypothetical protein C8J57DRAFT_524235 [Mycena rebaudengoi]